MGKLISVAIVVALGIFGYFHYRQAGAAAEAARIAALPPPPPPPPPRSLEERAAAAQGTALPPEARRVPVRTPDVERESFTPKEDVMRCDGRQYCSQMKSCEEAKWFQQHCADTKMDGDGDGLPCEDRCGH